MATLTPADWIRAATVRLAAGGVDAVRVESLAKELGVSKGSFYWHFEDRDALLQAVLEGWHAQGTRAVITAVEAAASTPRERLLALMREAYAVTGYEGFEIAVRAWAATDSRAREAVIAVDRARIHYVAELLEAAGVERAAARHRAGVLYRALLGEYVMRSYGTQPPTDDGTDVLELIAPSTSP